MFLNDDAIYKLLKEYIFNLNMQSDHCLAQHQHKPKPNMSLALLVVVFSFVQNTQSTWPPPCKCCSVHTMDVFPSENCFNSKQETD